MGGVSWTRLWIRSRHTIDHLNIAIGEDGQFKVLFHCQQVYLNGDITLFAKANFSLFCEQDTVPRGILFLIKVTIWLKSFAWASTLLSGNVPLKRGSDLLYTRPEYYIKTKRSTYEIGCIIYLAILQYIKRVCCSQQWA